MRRKKPFDAVRSPNLLFKKTFDVFHVIQGVVNEELELRHHAQLALDPLSQPEADVFGVGAHGPDDGILVGCHVNAQVCPCNRQVGRNGDIGHRHHAVVNAFAVLQEKCCQLALQKR